MRVCIKGHGIRLCSQLVMGVCERAIEAVVYVTCSAIWWLVDKDEDLRASHELLNTERISTYPKQMMRYDFLNVTGLDSLIT